jgi:hypothetical protein
MDWKKMSEDARDRLDEGVQQMRVHGPRIMRAMSRGMRIGQVIERAGGLQVFLKDQVAGLVMDILDGNAEIEIKRKPRTPATDPTKGWRPPVAR